MDDLGNDAQARTRATVWPENLRGAAGGRAHLAAGDPAGAPARAPAHPGELCLSAVEFDVCWELLGLDDTPPTLELASPGRSVPERHQLCDSVLVALRHRGLADRSAPGERVAGALRLLARSDHQLDLRLHSDTGDGLLAVGAAGGEYAVLAVRQGEQVRLSPTRPARLVPDVVGLVGPMTAGQGRAVNLPAEVFDAAWEATTDGALWTMADHLTEMGIPRLDASSCVRMCLGVRTLGQLGTAFRVDGMTRLGPWVIGFHSTDAGHFLQLRTPGSSGDTVTMCPLDRPQLARHAAELLATGPARQPQPRYA